MLTKGRTALTSQRLHSPEDALAYMTECTLATVDDLASKSKPKKSELSRQISIAQTGVEWVKTLMEPGDQVGCSRLQQIIDSELTVSEWVEARYP